MSLAWCNRQLTRHFRWVLAARIVIQIAALWILGVSVAQADDFQDDWRRLEDGLRTPGAKENIAAITSTLVVILVNGAEIGRTLIQPPGKKDDKDGQQRTLLLQVHTRDAKGSTSTTLDPNTGEPVFIQACVIDADKGAIDAGATATIGFALGAEAASLALMPPQGGWKVAALTPMAAGKAQPTVKEVTVYVSATIDGTSVNAPVKFALIGGYELVFF